MDIVAIIPARSGSKTIKDKNIKLLSGHPLISYSIEAAKRSSFINRVIVSTDSKKYARIAIKYNAEVPFLRPLEYSNDMSTDREFLIHAVEWFDQNENYKPEYWVHLRPTTPLRVIKNLDDAIEMFIENQNATSLRSAHKAPESPLKWFTKNKEGNFIGLNKTFDREETYNLPKEAFETVYVPNGYVDIIRRSTIISDTKIHGNKIMGYETPITTEVDTIEEFEYIKFQIHHKGSEIKNYLDEYSRRV